MNPRFSLLELLDEKALELNIEERTELIRIALRMHSNMSHTEKVFLRDFIEKYGAHYALFMNDKHDLIKTAKQ